MSRLLVWNGCMDRETLSCLCLEKEERRESESKIERCTMPMLCMNVCMRICKKCGYVQVYVCKCICLCSRKRSVLLRQLRSG